MFERFATRLCNAFGLAFLALLAGAGVAQANLVISSNPTANMNCGGGVCEPAAPRANLNVTDLENLISQDGNVRVMTTGQNVEATNIVVNASFATPNSTSLTLDAVGAITVNAPVSIGGGIAELELQSGTGGTLGDISFGPNGDITFGSTTDLFNINGEVFQLEGTLPDLAKAANAEPARFYALSNSYDASADGTYQSSPISSTFSGYFEALGNTISNLTINVTQGDGEYIGLFAQLAGNGGFGVVRNLRLAKASVLSSYATDIGAIAGGVEQNAIVVQSSTTGEVQAGDSSSVGGVAGWIELGSVISSWSSAKVTAGNTFASVGGLVGYSGGTIANSYATGAVTGGEFSDAGGLAGDGYEISGCFATGDVYTAGGGSAGGLVGDAAGSIKNSYAEGNVSGGTGGYQNQLGGLTGYEEARGSANYSTGKVTGGSSDLIGGVVGWDIMRRGYSYTFWDTTTSGLSRGAGQSNGQETLTGLTSSQLRSGLPAGFRKTVWNEKVKTNHGFPYLIDNPPPKSK
ncbi:MAG TPA: GLUG motif-containing protein [Rhizomicrobium sp.]|nr:GLUG motif-containing protein [Rhizomicrobium sp.]